MTHTRKEVPTAVSHRNHPLRTIQNLLEPLVPGLIENLDKIGLLQGTEVHQLYLKGESLNADAVTLSGLQLTINGSDKLARGIDINQGLSELTLGTSFDGFDGPIARINKTASPAGAVKDALTDRLAEYAIAGFIARHLHGSSDASDGLRNELTAAFHLSTLTKAISEMWGIPTSEGGAGGMLERRRVLLTSLMAMGIENSLIASNAHALLDHTPLLHNLRDAIQRNNQFLLRRSYDGARKRVATIARIQSRGGDGWDNPTLFASSSAAASEARKYAVLAEMNQKLGIDIVSHLNHFNPDVRFPSTKLLMEQNPYIRECMNEINGFQDRALAIAGVY